MITLGPVTIHPAALARLTLTGTTTPPMPSVGLRELHQVRIGDPGPIALYTHLTPSEASAISEAFAELAAELVDLETAARGGAR